MGVSKQNETNASYGKYPSHKSHSSHPPAAPERLLSPRGDYRTLLSFQKAEVIYDITFRFAHKFLSRTDRTIDQMIQSARSGKKNILEGSKAALTSTETEIKLTNVARASLEELLDDYSDYLRARDLPVWDKNSKEAQYIRRLGPSTGSGQARLWPSRMAARAGKRLRPSPSTANSWRLVRRK